LARVLGVSLGTRICEHARGLVGNIHFQSDPELGEQFEDAAKLDGRLAVLNVLSKLLADAGSGGQIVDADPAEAAGGADGSA